MHSFADAYIRYSWTSARAHAGGKAAGFGPSAAMDIRFGGED